MKKILKPIALLFFLAAAVSCKKNTVVAYVEPVIDNPIADYDIIPDPNDAFSFSFKNKTTNFKRFEWRFGDDTLTTVQDPTHTYYATGKYTVDLKAFSKTTAATTRKLVDLNIVPDSIIKITTTRTATPTGFATLQFGIKVKAPVKTIVYKFDDVAYKNGATNVDAKSESYTATSATDVPSRTYALGTFNTVTVTLTTVYGSKATITRGITTEGIAEDITQKRIDYSPFFENGTTTTGSESSSKLIDGNTATKFGIYGKGAAINQWAFTIKYADAVLVKLYMIANANDQKNARDPKSWDLEGSNDQGITWFLLDHQENGTGFYDKAAAAGATADGTSANPGYYFHKWFYTVPTANQIKYSWIRLSFKQGSFNNSDIQLSEFALFR